MHAYTVFSLWPIKLHTPRTMIIPVIGRSRYSKGGNYNILPVHFFLKRGGQIWGGVGGGGGHGGVEE